MSKVTKDSWFDSGPVYIVFAAAHIWMLLAGLFGWTNYGLNVAAAGMVWHIFGILFVIAFWVLLLVGKDDKIRWIDLSYAFWQLVAFILYVLPWLFLAGFTFNIAD